MEDMFVLKGHEQVETAYLAAWITGAGEDLREELSFYVSVLPADEIRFVATGEKAALYRQQAIDSLNRMRNNAAEHPHLAVAAHGLLRALRDTETN